MYLSEVGYQKFSEECMGQVGTVIDVATYPFSGIAAMHPWTGYSYGGVNGSGVITEIDRRWNWEPTIKAERFFNSGKFSTPLNTWNGFWKQGRQAENYHNNDSIAPKEVQYYLSEDNKCAVGYVRNRSYNVYTQRIDNSCSYSVMEEYDASSYAYPLYNFFTIYNHMGKKLYCYGVQKNQYHLVKWYDLDTNHIISQVYKSDNKNRLKLNHPVLNVGFPIVWFTVQNVDANGIPIISPSEQNTVILEEERTEKENYLDVSQSNGVFQKVVPNPFENELLIESSVEDVYRIIDLKGSTVLTGKVHIGQTRISTDMLNKGFYYITFANYGYSQKIVKQ